MKRYKNMFYVSPFVLLCAIAFSPICGTAALAEQSAILWEIGQADNDTREFALAPDGWDKYTEDAFYVVGRSDPKTDWPYVHPGPSDIWAEGRAHTFRVVFGISRTVGKGICELRIDLVNTHHTGPPTLTIDLNGYTVGFSLPKGGSDNSLNGHVEDDREYRFSCTIPVSCLKEGINTLSITNDNGSWCIYDAAAFEAPPGILSAPVPETTVGSVETPPLLVHGDGGLRQVVRAAVFNSVSERKVAVTVGGETTRTTLPLGESMIEATVVAVTKPTAMSVRIRADGSPLAEKDIVLKPVRKWEVYFLPHSHVDIGYTHLQPEVEQRQWDNIAQAIDLAEKTADYPEGARFKWNAEVLWAVDGLLRKAPEEHRRSFIEAARKGWIGIDALYGSMLTGLARDEELFEFTSFARRLRKEYGIPVTSAMITDVPGYVWGMVPALAQCGIRYFNPGPNHMPMLPHQGDRIGYTSEEWGDKPFWWVSPSGTEKVLVWIPTHGYSWFHDWILGSIAKAGAEPILGYIGELEEKGYPYDMIQLRYTIGADNGPPDPDLPEFVKSWNERYAWPRMVIATTGELFGEFERRYGDSLPEYSGDFTPYWEDGAASSAFETAMNRTAAERLVQAETLWSMIDPEGYPADDFTEAWRNIILYTEHTWGAHNSISDPESDFVKGQWAVKRSFAVSADSMASVLTGRALSRVESQSNTIRYIDVCNTSSWPRTDLVILPASWRLNGEHVTGDDGTPVPSQRLASGEFAFRADNVPPFSAQRYELRSGSSAVRGAKASAQGNVLTNGTVTVRIDPESGAITGLTAKGIEGDFAGKPGLNGYWYLPGKDPANAVPNGRATVTVRDNGPLVASFLIESEAPGARTLIRELRVASGLDRVDIINTIDKLPVTGKESVHFGFPFDVPGGQIRFDLAWGVMRPDFDQLPGGNRNVFSVQRWADVSNERCGVTLAVIDAPLMEIDRMNAEEWNLQPDRPWLKTVPQSQTLYSYVMNNYWHTNYRAYQEGTVSFRYSLRPHGNYVNADAKRFGMERSQPLIAVPVDGNTPVHSFPAGFAADDVIVTSVRPVDGGTAFLARLFNAGETVQRIDKSPFPHVWLSNPDGDMVKELTGGLELRRFGTVTLRCGVR